MPKINKPIIAISAPVEIAAAEGDQAGPAKFHVVAYTGEPVTINGWDMPVVVDIDGMQFAETLTANLDHDSTKRVGHVTAATKAEGKVLLDGVASAVTASTEEVISSGKNGYPWKASIEADPLTIKEYGKGKTLKANGREYAGPLYYVSESLLSGFGFVTRGADKNAFATIAASVASTKGKSMDQKCKEWIEAMGFDVDSLSADQLEGLQANYAGQQAKPVKAASASNPFEARKIEAKRRRELREFADRQIELRNSDEEEIIAIEQMHDHAVESGMSTKDFRIELYESITVPEARMVQPPNRASRQLTNEILEAAICQSARLPDIDKHYSDQTLQLAHDHFKGRIGLKQLFLLAAEANGHRNQFSSDVDKDTLRAAFSTNGHRPLRASTFSTLDISNVISNTANKSIMRGWNMVEQVCLRIAKIKNVRDFKTATTVSLTDSVIYEKVGASGEIKHGTLSDLTYTSKADTYARMLAITRQDIINDDLGALTDVPMKLGSGAMKKLNDIFWTEFLGLVSAGFFASGNNNLNEGNAEVTAAGLAATEVIFNSQTNPDGTPLGVSAAIWLVPTAKHNAARTLMESENLIDGTATATQGGKNIFAGRYRVESSKYIHNTSYTGYTSVGNWLLADPEELPVIAIAALNGKVEPTVETADADFNVLGVQMRGYSDVGVDSQEYRGGVYADGGAS